MIDGASFLCALESALEVDFFTGVPDSLLQALCDSLYSRYGVCGKHVVAANEGAAVGLAAGHYIATGRPAMVYMQNSGIGNAVNPIASLLNEKVYGIPCVFVIGWRGEPGVKDEPQHVFQGEITPELLKLLGLHVFALDGDTTEDDLAGMLEEAKEFIDEGKSVAFLAKKKAFSAKERPTYPSQGALSREDVIRVILSAAGDDLFVSTTGKTSREVYESRIALGQESGHDFLTVGSMGHASMIALGIALASPGRTVWCLDGDGAALMHMGSLVVESLCAPRGLIHVLINNGAHESVGGMPVAQGQADFPQIAKAAGFANCYQAEDAETLAALIPTVKARAEEEPCFIEIRVRQGSRDDLGRPKETPKENLNQLMNTIRGEAKK